MANLKGSKTHQNLKDAFAGESQANRRYLYFAKVADVEGYPEVASNFRETAEGETGHAHGHLDFLKAVGDPATGLPLGDSALNLKAACRQAGLKVTHQRLEVFREVATRLDHPDAEAVFRVVRARLPTVSLDTVYRTLSLLGELGLVTPLGPRRESVRFDANLARHHHYVCVRCGLTRDFESPALDTVRVPSTVKELGSVVAMQIEVRGLCAACARIKGAGGRPRASPGRRAPGRRGLAGRRR